MQKSKKLLLLMLLVIFIVLSLIFIFEKYKDYKIATEENELIDLFLEQQKREFNKKEQINLSSVQNDSKNNNNKINYIAVLEIPSISLKKGLVEKNSKYNNVTYNVQILGSSDLSNIPNENIILASHSGNSRISFFKNLYKLQKGDYSYIYYNGVKYTYKVVNIYNEDKDGTISIDQNKLKNKLILTTCNQQVKNKQIVVISDFIKAERL